MHLSPKIPGLNKLTVNGNQFSWENTAAASGYFAVSEDARGLKLSELIDAINQENLEELEWNYGGGPCSQNMVRALLLNYLESDAPLSDTPAELALQAWFEYQQQQIKLNPLRVAADDATEYAEVQLSGENGARVSTWVFVSGHELYDSDQEALSLGRYFPKSDSTLS